MMSEMGDRPRFHRGPGRRGGSSGFTILEIMIATAILTVGLVGILALFPVAIHSGKQIIQKSMAVVIAESVADSIREGMRNNLRSVRKGEVTHSYFIFRHDGVKDEVPTRTEMERPDKDYYILLPRFRPRAQFPDRQSSARTSKVFLYPETDSNANGNGDAFLADDDSDDLKKQLSDGTVKQGVLVERTYQVGRYLPAEDATGETVLDDQRIETLKQYSFAFTVQVSLYDTNLSQVERFFEPANRLYTVKIMVFQEKIIPGAANPPVPALELDFEVAL
jgi:type II secretory pathway pseudopilin PulG